MTEQEFGIAWAKEAKEAGHKAKLPVGLTGREDKSILAVRQAHLLRIIEAEPGLIIAELHRRVEKLIGKVSFYTIRDDLRRMQKSEKCHQKKELGGYFFGRRRYSID